MANEKVETKVGLLLLPQQLTETFYILASFHVHKSSQGIAYDTFSLESRDLKTNHTNLPKQAADIVMRFSEKYIDEEKYAIKARYAKQRAGMDVDVFLQNAMLRHLHELMNMLKPFFVASRWYHKALQADKKNYKTSPCKFSNYRPQLSFGITKEHGLFGVQTSITLNGATYLLTIFNRYQFLLESGNEYFLLPFKDYQTIEWLEKNMQQYQSNEEAFVEHVLTRLEIDYAVERNSHFSQNEIAVVPTNRILLSELNNSFLMLTPQWLYDGFLVDGAFTPAYETKQNGIAYSIQRNKEAEQEFVKTIENLHPNFPKQKNGYYYLSFADAQKKQWFLKAYHHLLELNIDIIGMDMLKHFKYSSFKAETVIVIKEQTETRLLLEMKTSFGKEEIALKELQRIMFAGQRAVLLKDGSLGVFSDEWIKQYASIIKHGKINGSEIEVARWMAIAEEKNNHETPMLQSTINKGWWQKWHDWQTKDEPVYQVPSFVQATLRPYQQKGFEWLALLADVGAGGCLADDMGLGKTLQTICFLSYYIHHHPGTKSIIICPSSLIYNWQNELLKFVPSIKVMVYHGANRKQEDLLNEETQIIITSYGTVRADNGQLFSLNYGVSVVDESHNIKNPSAQITKAISALQANINIALSGTPVVNNTFDLYAQLNFALPGMFGSRDFFKREYADAIDRFHDEEKIAALQKMTAPFILRRTKEQVAKDLPAKTESILWCNMHVQQRMVYNDIAEQIKSNIFSDIKEKGLGKSKLAVLQGIMKLRQVCNTPLLLPQEEQQGCNESIKTEMLMNELQNILGNHKAIVFSQFSSMLNLLAKECDKQGIQYFHFDGQTPPAKRAEMVAAFQEKDCNTHLFLISLKAGNTGLTLTAADYVFLFDPWWNTAIEQQAIDRTHRIGQTKNVFAYKIICKDTIEEKIIKLQEKKKQLADELVTEDDGFVKSLSEEDVAYLFG
jgi:SNF2 family DNA or RNA helicase